MGLPLLGLLLVPTLLPRRDTAPPRPEPFQEALPEITTNLLALPLSSFDPKRPLLVEDSLTDRLFSLIDPEALQSYEGSYTTDDLLSEKSGTPSVTLKSCWFFGNEESPQVAARISRAPLTGAYEVSGGELFLPRSGMGLSVEKDIDSGETRTVFSIKRDF